VKRKLKTNKRIWPNRLYRWEMINNRELAEHLRRHITDLRWGTRGELFTKLTTDALQVWIEQFKIKDDANLLDPKPAMVMNRGATKNNIERSIQEI
jgi:hypothetical protein